MKRELTLQQAMSSVPEAVKAFVNELSLNTSMPFVTPGDVLAELLVPGNHTFFCSSDGQLFVKTHTVTGARAVMAWCEDSFEWLSVTDV